MSKTNKNPFMNTYYRYLSVVIVFLFCCTSVSGTGLLPHRASRVLSTCYEVVHTHNGLENSMYNADLEDTACEVKSLISSVTSESFDVVGHDYYPLLSYVAPNYNFDYTYKCALRVEEENRAGFLLIAKDHLAGAKLAYRVKLRLPAASPFDTITAIEELQIAELIKAEIEREAAITEYKYYGNSGAEIAGLQYFKQIIQQIIVGSFSLDLSLSRAGFDAEPIPDPTLFSRGVGTPFSGSMNPECEMFDFVSLEVQLGNSTTLFRDLIALGFEDQILDVEGLPSITGRVIITDDLSSNNQLALAETAFDNSEAKMTIWFHHTTDTLYSKKAFTFTQNEINIIIGHYYLESMKEWVPELAVYHK